MGAIKANHIHNEANVVYKERQSKAKRQKLQY